MQQGVRFFLAGLDLETAEDKGAVGGVDLADVDDDHGLGCCRSGAYVGELKNLEHGPHRKGY